MPETNINQAVTTNISGTIGDFSVQPQITDGPADQKETFWDNTKFSQYLGYYKTIPELTSTIDARATWTVGKGFKADKLTTFILQTIKGFGVDTFNTILENMIRTMFIGGDSFCEIIRNKEGFLINLKPLDPSVIRIVVNKKGIIIRYEQRSKVKGSNKKFKPEQIFHLARNRVADEIHGVSVIEKLEQIILARNEAITDYKKVLHRNVEPLMIIHADTDDTTAIAKIKSDWEKIKKDGETWIVPKDIVVPELLTVAPNATMNPLPWIESLNDYFYEACGTPKIIVGNSKNFTEASAKIVYLAFQQSVEEDQLYIEEQVGMQLGFSIELEFPASLENELLSDKKKDRTTGAAKPSQTTAGSGQ